MTIDFQGSLFGEGKMTPPARASIPDPETIRRRLNRLLQTLRAADVLPLSEKDVRMWRAVVPNMTKWLPEPEGAEIRNAFHREMERLSVSA